MNTNTSEAVPLGPFQHLIDSFLDHLHADGYVPQSVAVKRSIAIAFARWSQGERIGVEDLSKAHLATFMERRPPRPYAQVELRALRQFLAHVRIQRGLLTMNPILTDLPGYVLWSPCSSKASSLWDCGKAPRRASAVASGNRRDRLLIARRCGSGS